MRGKERLEYIKGVVTLDYKEERCTGCGLCSRVCPHAVFTMGGGRAVLTDRDRCMECGACMMNCPAGAIYVKAGVGCAYAVIRGTVRGTEPDCGIGGDGKCCD